MARKKTTRSIRLPGGGSSPGPAPMQGLGAGPDTNDQIGRAMADIHASAQVRNRDQLPSRVKVITPQVIMNIVTGITDKLGMEVDREEFNQLVMQQTQMEMKLSQAQEKLEQYKTEYKKVYDAWQQSREMLQSGGAGSAELDEVVQQYEAQIGEWQQRNAEAVDIYMGLQRQLDETMEQYQALEQQLQELQVSLEERDAELANAAPDEGQTAQIEELQQHIETLQAELEQAQQQPADSPELEELRGELENLRNEEGAWLEEKRRMANQLSNETSNRQAAEAKLEAIESGDELPASAKAVQERAEKAEQQLKEVSEKLKQLESDLEKSGNAAKELGVLKRKFEGVETELEELRAAEGKWLEEKRRMAAQLSNETNLRRELEAAQAETAAVKKKSSS